MTGVILINYNSSDKTRFCLESLKNQSHKKNRIYLFDNFSKSDELEKINNLYEEYCKVLDIIFQKSNENIGFSKSNNILIKRAFNDGCEYIYILNNDVELLPDTIEKFHTAIEKYKVEIVTNKILFRSNKTKIWFAGGEFDYRNANFKTIGYEEKDSYIYSKVYDTEWASGASSFFTKNSLQKIGLYDENYFFGQEEWDISVSALKNKFRILYDGSNPVYHDVGGSTKFRLSFKIYLNTYNRLFFARKNLKQIDYLIFLIRYILYCLLLRRKRICTENKIIVRHKIFYKIQLKSLYDFFTRKKVDFKRLEQIDIKYV